MTKVLNLFHISTSQPASQRVRLMKRSSCHLWCGINHSPNSENGSSDRTIKFRPSHASPFPGGERKKERKVSQLWEGVYIFTAWWNNMDVPTYVTCSFPSVINGGRNETKSVKSDVFCLFFSVLSAEIGWFFYLEIRK